MPELPEVETVRRTLAPAIGAKITGVWDSGMPLHMQRRPPRKRLKVLVGAKISGVRRHGKYLLVDTDRPETLLVHLGMTGRFCLHGKREPRGAHTHLVLELGRRELRFTDARRFGLLDVLRRGEERSHPALAVLGPDALEHQVDAEVLLQVARSRRRTTLKAFLLDQSVIAGVGNIYASEALWRAGIRPTTRTRRLTRERAARLARAIREVLANALENGGTTLADFVAADGKRGENASYLWVYDREGEPCLSCKGLIRRSVLQGRATFFCPTCQVP